MFSSTIRLSVVGLILGLLVPDTRAEDKPAEKPIDLKVGDPAPVFEILDAQGKGWKSADHYGKKWVVIYFYPGDFTPGCTAQANAFRDAMNKLTEQGVEVVGVSGDSVKTHELFKKAQKLNFNLLSDEGGTLALQFGVPVVKGAHVKAKDPDGKPFEFKRALTASRWTFVVGKDGKIAYKNTKVMPADDAKKISDFIAATK
jgi:thioredoxin-dependent peroxiredoxin